MFFLWRSVDMKLKNKVIAVYVFLLRLEILISIYAHR